MKLHSIEARDYARLSPRVKVVDDEIRTLPVYASVRRFRDSREWHHADMVARHLERAGITGAKRKACQFVNVSLDEVRK